MATVRVSTKVALPVVNNKVNNKVSNRASNNRADSLPTRISPNREGNTVREHIQIKDRRQEGHPVRTLVRETGLLQESKLP